MPLKQIEQLNDHQFLGIWEVEESPEELLNMIDLSCEQDPVKITHEIKRKEWYATRILMRKVVESSGDTYIGITKDEYGKPWLNKSEAYISVTHCFPLVVVLYDQQNEVGVDIEMSRQQIDRIAHKFLSEEEASFSTTTEHHMVMWAAKESLYKLHGRKSLTFKEQLLIDSFPLQSEGVIHGRIIDNTIEEHKLYYRFIEENKYVLVHSIQ